MSQLSCDISLAKLAFALLLFVPIGTAAYFWRKKCHLEERVKILKSHIFANTSPSENIVMLRKGKNRSKNNYERYPYSMSMIELQKEKDNCKSTNMKKENAFSQKPRETVKPDNFPNKEKDMTEAVNWLSRSLEATNISLLELMGTVVQVSDDIKTIHGDNKCITRRLAAMENHKVKAQRRTR